MNDDTSAETQQIGDAGTEDERVDAVLAALAEVRPREGLQQRVLQRLAAEATAPAGRPVRLPWLVVATVGTCALCVSAVLLRPAGAHDAGSRPAAALETRATAVAPGAEHRRSVAERSFDGAGMPLPATQRRKGGRTGLAATPGAARETVAAATVRRQAATVRADASSTREKSFPAPPMPLTEQERLLLQMARQNDPVQVAMLDRTQREREVNRERVETARFFTPAPLPPSLQREVNAALRSQYVNTPPPRELLAQNEGTE